MNVDYFVTGPRMRLLPARALQAEGRLNELHIDLGPSDLGGLLAPLGRNRWRRHAPEALKEVPRSQIRGHPMLLALSQFRRHAYERHHSTALIDAMMFAEFRSVARTIKSQAVCGLAGCSLEVFEGRAMTVLEQMCCPPQWEFEVAQRQRDLFPEWVPPHSRAALSPLEARMPDEWHEASIVWAPSSHVILTCRALGADVEKFRLLPYPIPNLRPSERPVIRGRRKLKVLYVGALRLTKGVQYLQGALFNASVGRHVDMHWLGPSGLTPHGMAALADVGRIHGSVPRTSVEHAMRMADVLVCPSLSEGSALVTLEATALGLPVIATAASGAPASAAMIAGEDIGAIRAEIEHMLDDRGRLLRLSKAALEVAGDRTEGRFIAGFNEMLRTAEGR